SQGAIPSNAGSQEDDSDSDDEPDVLIIQSTPTPVTLQRQEQAGKEEADRLRLTFPSLNPMLGVDTSSISSFVSAGSTPLVSAGSTPQMSPCASPISAGRLTGSAGRPDSAGRPTGSIGRPVSASRPLGSAGRPSGSADRSSVPAGHILGQSNAKEPTTVAQALVDPDWVEAMQEYNNSGIKRIEAIRLFLAFASFIGFKVYQMDVKSAFLYGKIAEEVYVTQPRGFKDPDHPKRVYKVVKALYGLHQAPRAWYERLSTFLLKHGYRRGTIDKTLFIKKDSKDIMLVQVYVDDIIFGSTRKDWWLQVDQRPNGIFIHQEKYVADILIKFDLDNSKLASTPFEPQKIREKNVPDEPISVHLYRSMIGCLMYLTATRPDIMFAYLTTYPKLGLWYPQDSPFDLKAFSDSDYAGAHGDRKSTTG
nr:putative ribonuclease H-like domain-containing protein [Tanacetum cinerariifolium]